MSFIPINRPAAPSIPQLPLSTWAKLVACIGIDLLSDSSFLIPGVGEAEDIAWAPISAFLLKTLFDSNIGIIPAAFLM